MRPLIPAAPVTAIALLMATFLFGQPVRAAEPITFDKQIRPLLTERCVKCHGPEKHKGGVNFADFTDEASARRQRKVLRKLLAQVEAKEMPPPEAPPLTEEQRGLLLRWAKSAIESADSAPRDPGPAILRRLNRTEYERTIADLVGIRINARELVGLPDDRTGERFDNLANGLNLSPAQLEKYFLAADKILERLLGTVDGSPSRENFNRGEAQKAAKEIVFVRPGAGKSGRDAAREVIARFARRGFRRPVSAAEIDRLMRLYDPVERRGDRYENALRPMLKAVLVSPHFLMRVERNPAADTHQPYPVNDHELAVRLSYFLWSTMPDPELFTLAEQKKLSEPAVLEQQVKRMLANPKARALTDYFGVQWLQLRKVFDARPSQEFFPTFNNGLRHAMYNEAVTFFDKLREEDRSVLELLDADYTYVNEELAKHYQLAGVTGPQMRKVPLRAGDHRGGLLGMACIHTMTSHTSRTSPTLRGKWVLDVVFGTPPAPPPPEAGSLKEQKKGEAPKTFRELMAQHAAQASCAGCHKKMDPLGYALDRFDAIGRWRDNQNGLPLDTSGVLPTGEKFDGPDELKKIVLARREQFVRNMTEQLLVYALGRELQDCDEAAVNEATAALRKDEHRFGALVRAIVQSYPFRHRRGSE